jgi:cell division protein FtsW (lipid II flippase)
VTSAREILQSSPFIQLNLSFTMNIPNCDLPTAISDYCLVMLTQVFGKVIGFVIPLVMIVLLIIAFTKCDCLGKCASLMMLMQIVVQISGILGFCFTGINLPIISSGASSMFSSLVLTTFISFSMSHNKKEEIKRKNL